MSLTVESSLARRFAAYCCGRGGVWVLLLAVFVLILAGCGPDKHAATPAPVSSTSPAPADTCSAPMAGIRCLGLSIHSQQVASVGECCSLCSRTAGCNAYSAEDMPVCPADIACATHSGACFVPGSTNGVTCLDTEHLDTFKCPAGSQKCGYMQELVEVETPTMTTRCFLKPDCRLMRDETRTSGNPYVVVPAPLAFPICNMPPLGVGEQCVDNDISTSPAASNIGDCCEQCANIPGCKVFMHSTALEADGTRGPSTCHFKSQCTAKVTGPPDVDVHTGWAPPPPTGESIYRVGRGLFHVEGYRCGNKSPQTIAFYPLGNGPFGEAANQAFPVVAYGHGAWGYLDGNDRLLETVASLGLIVLVPFTGAGTCGHVHEDMFTAIRTSRQGGAGLHPALASADFSSTGAFGCSMGARGAVRAGTEDMGADLNLRAVVSFGGASPFADRLRVPAMFATGTVDEMCHPDDVYRQFLRSPVYPKVFANVAGAFHMEAQEGMRLNLYGAKFLSCHVGGRQGHCDAIYGSGPGAIVQAITLASCVVATVPEQNGNLALSQGWNLSLIPGHPVSGLEGTRVARSTRDRLGRNERTARRLRAGAARK